MSSTEGFSDGDGREVHPIAATFPEMDAGRFAELKDDIAKQGVLLPVILWRGLIIDGRHRARACDELSITYPTQDHECDETELPGFVWSLNAHRRDLSPSQRAMAAAKMAGLLRGSNRFADKVDERIQPSTPIPIDRATRAQAAKLAGVGTSTLSQAINVLRYAPEEVKRIERGEVTVNAVIEARREKPHADPVPTIDVRKDRAIRLPAHERFARAVEMMETALSVALDNVGAIATDTRRSEMLDSLRSARSAINRIIKSMEIAA